MHDGRVERSRQGHDLGVDAGAARAAHHGDALAAVQQRRQGVDIGIGRPHEGGLGASQLATLASVASSATSPGMTTTDTPRRAMAMRIAFSRMRGIWSGLETSST